MKVKAPFITLEPMHKVVAGLRVIKITTFSAAHPEGLSVSGHLYEAVQHLPKPLYVTLEFPHEFPGEPI